MEVDRNFLTKNVTVSVMAMMALHNLSLTCKKGANCTVAQLFTEMDLDLRKETETLVPKESPVTYPKIMLSLCQNLSLVDFYL